MAKLSENAQAAVEAQKSLADIIREKGSVAAALGLRDGQAPGEWDGAVLTVDETVSDDLPKNRHGNSDGALIVYTHALMGFDKGSTFTFEALVERVMNGEKGARRGKTTAPWWVKQLVKSGHLKRIA